MFPYAFKTAAVKPLLKKPNLDSNALTSYRPISNFPLISANNLLFRTHHSTETALTKMISDLRLNYVQSMVSILVLLDLSAVFDMIDYGILINRLEKLVGLSACVLNWFKTYIK